MPPEPLLRAVDAVTVPVPNLEAGLAFYRGTLGHQLRWRNEALGQAALQLPGSSTELVLSTRHGYEPDWLVASAEGAVEVFRSGGGTVVVGPADIPVGRLAVVEDPFGNRLVLLDLSKGTYVTDAQGSVTGVSQAPSNELAVRACAGVVAVDTQGAVLLVKRVDDQSWGLPGGGVEAGETWAEAAQRECLEETGWEVQLNHVLGIYSDPSTQTHRYPSGMTVQLFGVVFAGKVGPRVGEPDREVSDVGFFSLNDLPKPLFAPDVPVLADARRASTSGGGDQAVSWP